MTEYIENPLSGKLRGVTYEDGKIIDVHIRDTDDVVKVFVPVRHGRWIDKGEYAVCTECGSEVWLKWDEKTGKWTEWTRETGGKMNVSWIKAETKPPKNGEYYTIAEMQRDGIFYKKGDIVIELDWYSDMLGWEASRGSLSEWKVLAWAEIPLPDVPKEVEDRLVKYFDTEVKNRRDK